MANFEWKDYSNTGNSYGLLSYSCCILPANALAEIKQYKKNEYKVSFSGNKTFISSFDETFDNLDEAKLFLEREYLKQIKNFLNIDNKIRNIMKDKNCSVIDACVELVEELLKK